MWLTYYTGRIRRLIQDPYLQRSPQQTSINSPLRPRLQVELILHILVLLTAHQQGAGEKQMHQVAIQDRSDRQPYGSPTFDPHTVILDGQVRQAQVVVLPPRYLAGTNVEGEVQRVQLPARLVAAEVLLARASKQLA